MFCANCGEKLTEDALFCPNCGRRIEVAPAAPGAAQTPLTAPWEETVPDTSSQEETIPDVLPQEETVPDAPSEEQAEEQPSPHVVLCPDGKYRWIYEFHMLKNPVILFTIWKIFGIVILAEILLTFIIALFGGDLDSFFRNYLFTPQVFIVPGILFGLSILGYLILAAMYKWKYIVLFEMNEEGVRHIQEPSQFEKAQGLMWLTAMTGASRGSYSTAGAGMLAASKSESRSSFSVVKSVRILRAFHTIKVNELLEHNQVYTEPEDFDFVCGYILDHIPETAKRRG